ncbi:MAG: ABC transporter permease [Devosia sp.]|uniref:ABC transporter permease n=1 Tax=Devosia sp. TaxID=1871048 RepID=UPI0019E65D61|nr:ABC transporter permease [Devosia sp.]MBF0679302.1 ABC transporter permease [Devosia sp.]
MTIVEKLPDERTSRVTTLLSLMTKPTLVLAVAWLVLTIIAALFAPILAPFDPISQNPGDVLMPPSGKYLLGTDDLGRDVLSRLIYGTQPTLLGMLIAISTAAVIGIPWGLVSGYVGGWVDLTLMRFVDALLVFPGLILTLALTSALGATLENTMFSLGIVYSPLVARVVRVGVLSVRNRDYVQITRMFGSSTMYRIFNHVLPSVLPATVVQLTLLCGLSVLAQTGLNFLGLGVPNPNPSWGSSVAETFRYLMIDPMAPVLPGVIVVFTVLAIYRVGDEVRDLLEIYSR